jgi:transposase
MKPTDLNSRPTEYKHERAIAEAAASDYLRGMRYLEISKKYGVSESSLRRMLLRVFGETDMAKKLRKLKKSPAEATAEKVLTTEERIAQLERELKMKDRKIAKLEYAVEVVSDYLGKDFGLQKKK